MHKKGGNGDAAGTPPSSPPRNSIRRGNPSNPPPIRRVRQRSTIPRRAIPFPQLPQDPMVSPKGVGNLPFNY